MLSIRALKSKLAPAITSPQKNKPLRKPAITRFSPALSGLRGLASVGVVLFHAGNRGDFPPIMNVFTDTLFVGVPIFLMLSMYLLLNRLDANADLKHYFKRRIIRIWPIYYGVLVVSYVFFPFPFLDFVRFLFFVEYYANPFSYFPVAVFWTLQLEEAAYLFIPLIHKFQHKNLLGSAIVVGAFGYLSYITFFSPSGLINISTLQILLPFSLIGYGFGIFAYTGVLRSKTLRWLSLAGLFGMALMVYNAGSLDLANSTQYFINNVLFYSVALVGFACIVARPPKFLGWFTVFGEESYALYAIHIAFVYYLGIPGIFCALGIAFAIEFGARPKEMTKRLRTTYSSLLGELMEWGRGEKAPIVTRSEVIST